MRRLARRTSSRLPALAPALALVAALAGACTLPAGTPATPGATPIAAATPVPLPSSFAPTRPFAPTPAPSPAFAVRVVREGDTLTALAEELETTPESLAYWNRAHYPSLDPDSPDYRPDRIEVGWTLLYLPGQVVDPENLPPAATGAPAATDGVVGPFPTLPPDGSAALVERGPRGLGGVALTFEYGGGAGSGAGPEAVVQWLAVNGIPATVFVGPGAVDAGNAAGAAVLRRLSGSPRLTAGLLAGPGAAPLTTAGLQAADAVLAPVLGRSTTPFVRPGDGVATAPERRAAGQAGWPWAIAWDVDPDDGLAPDDGGPIAEDIVTRVVSRSEGGSIVRLRLDGPRTLEALPGIVEGLAGAGLEILPLDDVLGR
jgi:hypothetical protein